MNLSQAWTILGRDVARVVATLQAVPIAQRGEAADTILEKARRMAGKVAAAHHPDRGGDEVEFKRVWQAFDVIEAHTIDFKKQLVAKLARMEIQSSKPKTVIEFK